MVPEGWTRKKFSDVTKIANGQVDPKVEPYSGMLHLGPENIESGTGQVRDCRTSKQLNLISGKYEFDEKAIVYSKIRPNLNKVCKPGFKGLCSADMYPIWAKDGLNVDYLYHYMLSHIFYRKAVSMSMRTGMPKINRSDLNAIRVLLPPVGEQKQIAKILSTWDEAIATTKQLLANSEQQKKALMQQLLTGKKRLPGFEGEWEKVKAGNLLCVRKEKKVPSEDCPLYSLTIENGVTPKTERYNREFLVRDSKTKKYKLVRPRDIVYNPANLRWGAINYSRESHSVVVSPIYEVLYLKEESLTDIRFIAQALMSPDQIRRFASMVEGTLMERKAVKVQPFLATKIPVPPSFEEQRAIADVLCRADEQVELLRGELEKLQNEKRALMQQLLTGKRRVKVDETEQATA